MSSPVETPFGLRPLTARSVIASTLLGTYPPQLPARLLVAAADLFGVREGAARTALSRMTAKGELEAVEGSYRLNTALATRQQRQDEGRSAQRQPWDGRWLTVIIVAPARTAAVRAGHRTALRQARLGELRDGVWARPDNLGPGSAAIGSTIEGSLVGSFDPEASIPVAGLWDLDGWQRQAEGLRSALAELTPSLAAGDDAVLPGGFMVSAAVLRLFQLDPLLPDELLPSSWPGLAIRRDYDGFDKVYRALLKRWFRAQRE